MNHQPFRAPIEAFGPPVVAVVVIGGAQLSHAPSDQRLHSRLLFGVRRRLRIGVVVHGHRRRSVAECRRDDVRVRVGLLTGAGVGATKAVDRDARIAQRLTEPRCPVPEPVLREWAEQTIGFQLPRRQLQEVGLQDRRYLHPAAPGPGLGARDPEDPTAIVQITNDAVTDLAVSQSEQERRGRSDQGVPLLTRKKATPAGFEIESRDLTTKRDATLADKRLNMR
jgi:hypothetical protein